MWNRTLRLPALALLTFLAGALLSPSFAADRINPTASLRAAIEKAMTLLDDPKLKGAERKMERREKLRGIFYKEFDFPELSKRSVGLPWKDFSKEQKERFITLFRHFLENRYLGFIEKYEGEKIEFSDAVDRGRVVTLKSVVRGSKNRLQLDFSLSDFGAGWKVFDLSIEGVSINANYRSQFQSILKKGGKGEVEEILKWLEQKNSE